MSVDPAGAERPECESVLPGEEGWDEARRPWNLAADQHPAAVAHPQTAADVVAAVRFARERGLGVAAQNTGHAATELDPLTDALLVRTAGLREIEIDPGARRARVGGGVQWGDVATGAAAHGLAAPAGSSGTVGVVGYTLGGGIGWLGRRHGLACNGVHAVELVTADGRLRRVDAVNDPELFWALRGGGGGNFGVVTAIEFALHPLVEIEAGTLIWPIERAPEVLPAWWALTDGLPEEVSTIGRVLRLPPLEELPEFLRGRRLVTVEVADLRGPGGLAPLIAPLRELSPEIDTVATLPAPALGKLHMDPEDPVPALGDGALLEEVSDATIDGLLAAVGPDSDTPLLSVELRQLGGALARPAAGGGVISHVSAQGLLFGVGIAPAPEPAAAIRAGIAALAGAMAPWTATRSFPNFAAHRCAPEELFGAEDAARLAAVRAAVDPDGLFRATHPVTAP